MTLMFTFLPYSIQKRDTLPMGHTTPNPNGKEVDVITSKIQALHKLNYCYSATIIMNIQGCRHEQGLIPRKCIATFTNHFFKFYSNALVLTVEIIYLL